MIKRILAALSALALLPATGPPADPPVAFGARPGIEQISLSPSGSKVAFIAPGSGQSTILPTVDAAAGTESRQALYADGKPERIKSCFWVSEERLVCRIIMMVESGDEVFPFYRLLAINSDGRKQQLLSRPGRADDAYVALNGGAVIDALSGQDGSVLMTRV